MQTAMYVNGYDTARLGLVVEQADGWMDGLSARDRVSQLPGRVGSVILAPEAETNSRTITVNGVLRAASVTLVRQAMLDLKDRLYRGLLEVSFVDQPDKFVLAKTNEHSFVATKPQFASPHSRLQFSLFCPDPLLYAVQTSVVGFSSVRASLPLGTAVSAPIIRIMGAVNNPVLTYRDFRGVVRQTMGFTVNLAATDYLEIDSELGLITKYASGVGASNNAQALWTSGDFIVGDPQDGDPANAVWPTIEVSAGTGEALYRRAWL